MTVLNGFFCGCGKFVPAETRTDCLPWDARHAHPETQPEPDLITSCVESIVRRERENGHDDIANILQTLNDDRLHSSALRVHLAAAEEKIGRLREALRNYCAHASDCLLVDFPDGMPVGGPPPYGDGSYGVESVECTCGLRALLDEKAVK